MFVRGNPEQARQALLERLTSVDPAPGTINTMRSIAGIETFGMRIAFWVTVVLGGLVTKLARRLASLGGLRRSFVTLPVTPRGVA